MNEMDHKFGKIVIFSICVNSLEYNAEVLKKVELMVALFSEYQLVTLKLVPAVSLV